MAALVGPRGLELSDETPETARTLIKAMLEAEPKSTRRVYAALMHKVWSLLIERRLDAEVRDWHGLLQNVKAAVRADDASAAERVTALSDLLRESISLAESSPAREVARRPNARRLLSHLAETKGFVPRRQLLDAVGLKTSYLSNILTQLLAHGLVERKETGKEAEFRLSPLGREIVTGVPTTLAPTAYSLDEHAVSSLHSSLRHVETGTIVIYGMKTEALDTYYLPAYVDADLQPADAGDFDAGDLATRRTGLVFRGPSYRAQG